MTDTSKLDQLLQFLLDSLVEAKQFTLEQAPLFAQELLRWKFWEAIIWLALGILGMGFFIWTRRKLTPLFAKSRDNGLEWLICGVGFFLTAGMTFDNLLTAVQVYVAPRVVLIQMLRDMVKNTTGH